MAAIDNVRHAFQLSPASALPSKLGSESASRSEMRGFIRSAPRLCQHYLAFLFDKYCPSEGVTFLAHRSMPIR